MRQLSIQNFILENCAQKWDKILLENMKVKLKPFKNYIIPLSLRIVNNQTSWNQKFVIISIEIKNQRILSKL
jgi:hypothetical protein